ncbi:nucleotide disphospho-sugar-binding domain-containing protein [Sphingomonas sp. BK235]|uniref:glycosyltransferase n=1 Tax=Sphingomonas sp. BK235 TaxID=2512131 RepID=UPI00104B0789|nr:nucleotide disphospho-sugar-binding domain-containing protein [Sphingomonas sp. BK235]TCP33234.1 UDP:flavonoid glycosyltransferase YjiC (YdhE family) [Sphingomonas sp. BK235]
MARVIPVTIGSLGDLHPFIAIGRALTGQGHRVVLAVPDDGAAKVRAAGLDAAPILPSYGDICARLGMSPGGAAARVLGDANFVVDQILIPSLRSSTAALDDLSVDADVIAGSIFALASEIVAEKRGLPLASVVLQAMTLFSAWQPPTAPRFGIMRHRPHTAIGRNWNRMFYALARVALRRRHARQIDDVRAAHGLPSSRGAPMLDHSPATGAVICCWSQTLGKLPPDVPHRAVLTGFPFFDSESGADDELAIELRTFLADGPPPLVFTLGSFAVASAGHFYDEAAALSRALGKRAVLLTGRPVPPRRDGDRLTMNYAPHSAVFPRASAIVHHGGIGTTGQALRAGRPQIVVPHFGDQFDNAARLEASGVSATIHRDRFKADRAMSIVSRILTDPAMADATGRATAIIAKEDGAAEAARHIAALALPSHLASR